MKILIAVPCMDTVYTEFMRSLIEMRTFCETKIEIQKSSLIYDSRNILAQKAVEGGFNRLLWLDSDMVFGPDLLERLSADLDEGCEVVSGLCFKRKNPIYPVIYSEMGYTKEDNILTPYANIIKEIPSEITEVKGVGLAATIMNVDVVERVFRKFGQPFTPQPGFGEDLSFCIKCEDIGIKIHCDPDVKVGHIAQTIVTEETYRNGVIL